jgi:XTP/dITP diphosphohydrolase
VIDPDVLAPVDLVLATRNPGKAREFARLLERVFSVRPLPPAVALPHETGPTFAANARLKAEAVFSVLGGEVAVLADDSGLEVAALDGRPGVLSARYAGDDARDEENVGKLLAELSGRADRTARFVCALCLALPPEQPAEGPTERVAKGPVERPGGRPGPDAAPRLFEARGVLEGVITQTPRGTEGFGYDPVFQPRGWERTLSEASPADKDGVSHRGAAARALLARLRDGVTPAGEGGADCGS